MDNINQKALEMHRKNRGKIEVKGKVPIENKDDLSLAYTPGVGHVSSEIGKNKELARELTLKGNSVAIVSDGSAILGLGNLGAEAAIPVMEGKAALFKRFADIDAFPICLSTQDAEEIIKTVKNIAPVFGGVNLEDISAPRCFEIERRLREELPIPVMHDDQHGTAVVVLAGVINSMKLAGLEKEKAKIVVSGAGAAGTAVAKIMLDYGFKDIVVLDSKGIINKERGDLSPDKKYLSETTNPRGISGGLAGAVKGADIFIGVSKPGILTGDMVRAMNARPVIFALANPVPEIMPDIAKEAGAFIVATGRSDFPNQVNNVLSFPGIFRGALDNGIKQFDDKMFIVAAEKLAAFVKNPSVDKILPSVFEKGVTEAVAAAIKD
ncbi:MAG: NADP-dependent malic enzyme [Candidatus Liptonbacteria bacterium]|nr:NADP-dependent malic enzyme [Candidatus Liptonbacteria bacterium]